MQVWFQLEKKKKNFSHILLLLGDCNKFYPLYTLQELNCWWIWTCTSKEGQYVVCVEGKFLFPCYKVYKHRLIQCIQKA